MAVKYAVVALLAVIVTTFALQNTAPTSVRFLVWTLDAVPLAGVVLLAVAAGLLLAGIPLLVTRLRYRSRVRSLESRLTELQTRNVTPPRPPAEPKR
jgi:lipopolysaccharide assembly protein A